SLNKYFTAGAQCFPRLACPLRGSVFMQVHGQVISSRKTVPLYIKIKASLRLHQGGFPLASPP
ncbi:TPA: hypothetical protein ACTYZB_005843, partial [Klebsiella variicola]